MSVRRDVSYEYMYDFIRANVADFECQRVAELSRLEVATRGKSMQSVWQ
jgi:hypothetical protein